MKSNQLQRPNIHYERNDCPGYCEIRSQEDKLPSLSIIKSGVAGLGKNLEYSIRRRLECFEYAKEINGKSVVARQKFASKRGIGRAGDNSAALRRTRSYERDSPPSFVGIGNGVGQNFPRGPMYVKLGRARNSPGPG
jgi:hypothetical protein